MTHDRFYWKVPKIQKETAYHCTAFLEHDFWQRIREVMMATGEETTEMIINTWTLKNEQTDAIMQDLDNGHIEDLAVMTGINFKNKTGDRYARILEKLDERGKQLRSFMNHAKICIFITPKYHITIEGSANLWGHVAVEQFTVTESMSLYYFNKNWMKHMLNR